MSESWTVYSRKYQYQFYFFSSLPSDQHLHMSESLKVLLCSTYLFHSVCTLSVPYYTTTYQCISQTWSTIFVQRNSNISAPYLCPITFTLPSTTVKVQEVYTYIMFFILMKTFTPSKIVDRQNCTTKKNSCTLSILYPITLAPTNVSAVFLKYGRLYLFRETPIFLHPIYTQLHYHLQMQK